MMSWMSDESGIYIYLYVFKMICIYIYTYISTNSTDSGEITLDYTDITHTLLGFSMKLRSRASLQHQWKEVGITAGMASSPLLRWRFYFWRFDYVATVDGRNPANQLRLAVYPIIYRVLCIPGGAGFLNHQQICSFTRPASRLESITCGFRNKKRGWFESVRTHVDCWATCGKHVVIYYMIVVTSWYDYLKMSCQAHPQHAYFQVIGSTKTPPVRVGFLPVAFWYLFRWNARQVDFCGTAKQSIVRLLFSRCENSGTSGILAPWLCRKPRCYGDGRDWSASGKWKRCKMFTLTKKQTRGQAF